MVKVTITTEFIKLGQLLKLSGALSQGSDVKVLLEEGAIFVNGEKAFQRGKKIYPGDVVEMKDFDKIEVITEQE